MMRRVQKGRPGYLRFRRGWMLAVTLLLLAGNLLMFFIARSYFGSEKNLFSIFCALLCLPIAKYGVTTLVLLRSRGCSPGAAEQIRRHAGGLDGLYDLYLTSYDRNFQISHAAFACRTLAAFTETPSCDGPAAEKHIRTMLENNGIHGYSVKLFYNLDRYLERLDSLSRLQEGAQEDRLADVRSLLLSISL